MLVRSLEIRRRDAKPFEIAATLSTLAVVRLGIGDADEARAAASEAVDIFRKLGTRTEETIALLQLGQIQAYVGDHANAQRQFEQCLAVTRDLQYRELESECELRLGELALEAGDANPARVRFQRAVEISRDVGDKRGETTALWWLGKADLARGDTDAARVSLGGALRAFQVFDMFAELLGCLEDHAALLQSLGNADGAARLCAASEASRKRLALPRPPKAERKMAGGCFHAPGDARRCRVPARVVGWGELGIRRCRSASPVVGGCIGRRDRACVTAADATRTPKKAGPRGRLFNPS